MQSQEQTPAVAAVKTAFSTNGKEGQVNSEPESMEEEAEFNWEEFMEEAGSVAAPHTAFRHVEVSLQSSFQPGMKLEVANKGSADTYWVATIVATCGQLLLLRFSGYGLHRNADFWCHVMSATLHPVGWCSLNNRTLAPPEAIKEKYHDWTQFLVEELTGSRTAPASLLEGPLRGKNPVDLMVEGSLLELQDHADPSLYWPARVVRNVGGRLRLRPAGLSEEQRALDQWLFYLDVRLRPLGWALENRCSLAPPTELRPLKSAPQWLEVLEDGHKNPPPQEVFKDHVPVPRHSFKLGMKMEMVSPWSPLNICPVSVTKIFDEFYFQVTLDDLSAGAAPRSVLCHAACPAILPVQWSLKNRVVLDRPPGYQGHDFDWADYLKQSGAQAAPDACFPDTWQNRGFSKDMWLEAVNPQRPDQVCVAQVTEVRGRLLWLQLEGVPKSQCECIVDVESMDVFPVGWCEANSYPLTPPSKAVGLKQKQIAVVQPEKQSAPCHPVETTPANHCQAVAMDTAPANGRYCCSKIFVNHRCFSGPYLNKGRIAELPQAVGPGKCTLVLRELLSMLINAAYKPGRVLKELQDLQDQSWDCQEETLKAKYKGKTYRSTIRIVRLADQVSDFCRKVCLKLQCCPHLFSPVLVPDQCPQNCSIQTKTKYTYYYGKKRKLSRPGGAEEEMTTPTRRRRKRKAIFVQKKRRSSTVDYTPAGSPQDTDDDDFDFQSGSEGTSSEPREDPAEASSRDVTSSRPRRAAALRRSFSAAESAGGSEAPEARRRSTRSLAANNHNNQYQQPKEEVKEEEELLVLDRNPLDWSVADVVGFINATDCSSLAAIFQEQDIDGQALLLLTLPTVQECMELKLGPAIKLCHHIERVKVAFYRQYAN